MLMGVRPGGCRAVLIPVWTFELHLSQLPTLGGVEDIWLPGPGRGRGERRGVPTIPGPGGTPGADRGTTGRVATGGRRPRGPRHYPAPPRWPARGPRAPRPT